MKKLNYIKEWVEFEDEEDIIPVITPDRATYYVSHADMIQFITRNDPNITWNQCCKYIMDHHIVNDEGNTYWDKSILDYPGDYNEHQIKWITAFFEAHPFIERFYLVFDD
jgi:hypothetical protein